MSAPASRSPEPPALAPVEALVVVLMNPRVATPPGMLRRRRAAALA